jgi:hypothetical protein
VDLAEERHHVVFAMRIESYVLHQHEIVITSSLGKRAIKHLGRRLTVSLLDFTERVDHPLGRIAQSFTVRVVADKRNKRANGGFGLLARGAWNQWGGRDKHML